MQFLVKIRVKRAVFKNLIISRFINLVILKYFVVKYTCTALQVYAAAKYLLMEEKVCLRKA